MLKTLKKSEEISFERLLHIPDLANSQTFKISYSEESGRWEFHAREYRAYFSRVIKPSRNHHFRGYVEKWVDGIIYLRYTSLEDLSWKGGDEPSPMDLLREKEDKVEKKDELIETKCSEDSMVWPTEFMASTNTGTGDMVLERKDF